MPERGISLHYSIKEGATGEKECLVLQRVIPVKVDSKTKENPLAALSFHEQLDCVAAFVARFLLHDNSKMLFSKNTLSPILLTVLRNTAPISHPHCIEKENANSCNILPYSARSRSTRAFMFRTC
jgi:hypothetical protein